MKIAVVGLWHLGIVTTVCLAQAGHQIIGYDPGSTLVNNLKQGIAPIFEPGLDTLLQTHQQNIEYSSQPEKIRDADIVWVNFDTPVDENDTADTDYVIHEIKKLSLFIKQNALLLISSQLPVGTTRKLQLDFSEHYAEKNIRFGYIPENLRLGKAITVFTQADRYVVGLQDQNDQSLVKQLLGTFTDNFVWTSIESAEMTKHALNAFLALSVTFINEIATLCEKVGASASDVEAGLKSEERIGPKAYLRAGGAIAGGTLLRDIQYLNKIGHQQKLATPLLSAVLESNTYHKNWIQRKLSDVLIHLKNKTIAILGLTYKANTNTLRRSSSIETCQWLHEQGAKINAYDPAIQSLPNDYSQFIELKNNFHDVLHSADAVIVATEWADFRNVSADQVIDKTNQPIVLDANGFLISTLGKNLGIQYYSVGR